MALALFFAGSLLAVARAETLEVPVVAVDGDAVTLELPAGRRVEAGTPVTIAADMPGIGLVAISGEWRVVAGGSGEVRAEPVGAVSSPPRVGYTARVEASAAETADVAAPREDVPPAPEPPVAELPAADAPVAEPPAAPEPPAAEQDAPPASLLGEEPPQAAPPAPPAPDPATVRALQRELAARGYEPGPADGVFGPRTERAIRAFQRDAALAPDGQPTTALLEAVRAAPLPPRPTRDPRSDKQIATEAWEYYLGRSGKPQDYARAAELFAILAERGNLDGIYNLGIAYAFGRGRPQDYDRARQLFERAAAADHGLAKYNLGIFYYLGIGVAPDGAKALDYMYAAASAGVAEAMYELSVFFTEGVGTAPDSEASLAWLRRAAAAGEERAQDELTRRGLDW